MKIVKRIIFLIALTMLAACATGRTSFDKGQDLERKGKFDDAVLKYAEAVSNNPDISEYRQAFLKASEHAGRNHLKAGDEHFAAKRFDEAFISYQKATVYDPGLDRAKQQLEVMKRQKLSMVSFAEGAAYEKENKSREAVRSYQKALNQNPNNRDAAEAIERLLKTRKAKTDGFELNLKSTKPITLKFKDAKLKDVFNIVTQLSGINFVFDEGIKDANVTIFLENATFQQAIEIICGMHKLGRKVLNENTVIVYPRSPDKVKQYEDLYVQTFFLNKLDAKKAVNLIRTMLQVKKIYVNEEMNTLVIRDTADVIEVAKRILDANDVPDAEVLLEVEVIEVAKNNAESFGLALSRYAVGMNLMGPSGSFFSDSMTSASTASVSASGTTAAGTAVTGSTTVTRADVSQLLNLFRWGDYRGYVTVPNATFNFGKTLGNAETLSNPKIRVKNREKAKFNVGTRVPITTTTTNGTTSGYSVNVQYVDVGVKINAEPTIQLNNDVNIKLGLEVSSILSKDKVGADGATTVVTIGTRNMDTVLSLKDGETSVIGGLIQDSKSSNTGKVFLLGDIPVIGSLFSNKNNSGDKTELILAITPRIIRGITVSDPEIAAFWSGLEDEPTIAKGFSSFVQEPDFTVPASAPASAPAKQAQPVSKDGARPVAAAPAAVPALQAATQPVVTPQTAPVMQPQGDVVAPVPSAPTGAPVAAPPVTVVDEAIPPKDGQNKPVAQPPQPADAVVKPLVEQPVPGALPAQTKRAAMSVSVPRSVKSGEQFAADIFVTEANGLYSATFKLVFDPNFLEAVTVNEGDFFDKDGKEANFSAKVENTAGTIDIRFFREADSGGVSGAGRLFSVDFRAKGKGSASIGFTGIKLAGQGYKPVESTPYNAVIEVTQP